MFIRLRVQLLVVVSYLSILVKTEISDGSLMAVDKVADIAIDKRAVGDCGGTFYAYSGQFSSPGHPWYYSNKQECIYVMFIPNDDARILLEFIIFNTEPTHDVVRIYDGLSLTGTLIGEYSGSSIPPAVLSTSNVLAVTFTSDFSATRTGFLANYTAFSATRDDGRLVFISDSGSFTWRDWYDYGIYDCYYIIIVSQGYKVQTDMDINCCPNTFVIEVFDGVSQSDTLLGKFNVYYGWLRVTSTGRSLCVHIYQNVHSAYSVYVQYRAVKRGSYALNYYEATTWVWWWTPPTVFVTSANVWEYTTVENYDYENGCGGNYTSDTGSFSSPSYPGYYPNQQDCYYVITVSEGNKIVLHFDYFDTEVCCDFVEVFDGDSKSAITSMGKYFGSNVEAEMKSTGRSLFVHFHSDYSHKYGGFYATYRLQIEEHQSNFWYIVGGTAGAGLGVVIFVLVITAICCFHKKKATAPSQPREVQSMTTGGSRPDIDDDPDVEQTIHLGSIGRVHYSHYHQDNLTVQVQSPPYRS